MKKRYHLSYEFLGEARKLDFPTLFEFYQKLDQIMEDPQVNQQSISFSTEEI